MPGPSNILNALLYNSKTNLKILFVKSIEIETPNYNIFNKYAIQKFNQYAAVNPKDYSF